MRINLVVGLFNLIPAFPMDGGRVLRALIALRTGYARATRIAAIVGRVCAVGFGIYGWYAGQPFLVLIALFVWMGATGEAAAAQARAVFGGATVAQVMVSPVIALAPDDTLARAADAMHRGFQQDFPVVAGGAVVGVLARAELLQALARHDVATTVSAIMRRDVPTVAPDDTLDVAFARLQQSGSRSLPVVRGAQLVGMLTAEHLAEFLRLRQGAAPIAHASPRP
jgi:CBS domain-containing protein